MTTTVKIHVNGKYRATVTRKAANGDVVEAAVVEGNYEGSPNPSGERSFGLYHPAIATFEIVEEQVTEYNDENLLKLVADGLSYSEIATRLNVTRSVVAGRLARIRKGKIARRLQTNSRKPATGKLPPPQEPNKYSTRLNPRNHKPMTKSEMHEDLRKAVKNTK